jgi:hypothetical protein
MKVAIVSSKDVFNKTKNPTLCLSALRGLGECHQCDILIKKIKDIPLKDLSKELKCKPKISKENMEILKIYDEQLTKKEDILNDIEITEKRLGLR